jgi:hypothetical protein
VQFGKNSYGFVCNCTRVRTTYEKFRSVCFFKLHEKTILLVINNIHEKIMQSVITKLRKLRNLKNKKLRKLRNLHCISFFLHYISKKLHCSLPIRIENFFHVYYSIEHTILIGYMFTLQLHLFIKTIVLS